MDDFWTFRRMITPIIIQVIFWIGAAVCVLLGLVGSVGGAAARSGGGGNVLGGILMILLGPLAVRICCEILIVVFRVNNTLTDIRNALGEKPGQASTPPAA